MSGEHNISLAFPFSSARICAGVESLLGSQRIGYTQVVRGRQPRGPRPASLAGFSPLTPNTLSHVLKSGRAGKHKDS